ncbi:hypothetical protein IEQ34_020388 [Dendrobium chrysotoxum]|uniref:Uncharacterized protein n=1 Tax=Dendrobium chrysotoxum TaxID=161865 RepID=A0AAV7G0B3_DENCH|nr:hypothetical protein IEQ34_020388 [Dendrobium chrysotoxum]
MAPFILATESGKYPGVSLGFADSCKSKLCISVLEQKKPFASVTMSEDKPFDFLRVLRDGIIAGGTAGIVVETVLYPIDTIKTRLQAAHGGSKIHWKGLYSGLAGNLAGVLPASAVFIGIYEPTKQKLLKLFPENLSAFAHLTAGAIGGAASSLIRVPTEVVKQRMQTRQFTSASNAVRLILAKEGFRGLYAGYSSFLLRDIPFDAIQFCIYEQLRIGYRVAAKRELSDPEIAVIGAFAGSTETKEARMEVGEAKIVAEGPTAAAIGELPIGNASVAPRVASRGCTELRKEVGKLQDVAAFNRAQMTTMRNLMGSMRVEWGAVIQKIKLESFQVGAQYLSDYLEQVGGLVSTVTSDPMLGMLRSGWRP